ncbi:MAG TPA: bifunctional diguanylate cyclase/phosphodiesterase [Acidimicrobiales bacterium]|nr:bifunctional diguanylate cyclase/phosphodiesterase [Acidimicrobiales bacterium]
MGADSSDSGTELDADQRLGYLRLLERAASAANSLDSVDEAALVVVEEVCRFTGWTEGALRYGARVDGASTDPDAADLLTFPVFSDGGVAAVLEFRSSGSTEVSPELHETMTGVGRQLGRLLARQQAADRLRIELQQTLAERALRDELTGLPNRPLLLDRTTQALARCAARGSSVAVLCLDLDQFKSINDRFGRETGNDLLKAVADRLNGMARPGDTLARIAGDEFALLWEDLGGPDAVHLAEQVQVLFQKPFDIGAERFFVNVSAGVAVAAAAESGAEGHAEMLLREADAAMYRAKKGGRNRFEVFDETMLAATARRQTNERDLRHAIDGDELVVYYQPIVTLATGALAGVEALVRWKHPERGFLPPSAFIPLAEEAGLIVDLGRWVLATACAQAASWESARRGDFTLSVNVSAHQFQEDDWADEVAAALAIAGLEPHRLVVEITESVLAQEMDTARRRLEQLRSLGVRVAIDDFGTGYSSLGYLRHLPVDILKIDKSFIDGVTLGPHESALARAVVKLTKTLGLTAVAEGIEHEAQLIRLRRLGCQYGQGFYLGRPEPAETIDELLRGRKTDSGL